MEIPKYARHTHTFQLGKSCQPDRSNKLFCSGLHSALLEPRELPRESTDRVAPNTNYLLQSTRPYDDPVDCMGGLIGKGQQIPFYLTSDYCTVDRSLSCDVWICRLLFTCRTPSTCLVSCSARDFCSEDGTTPLN